MKTLLLKAAVLIVSLGLAHKSTACTTFVLSDGNAVLFARNLDWYWPDGFVVVNQRDIEKTAFGTPKQSARWTSKYGSVTFNQFGRELPFGGINEAGLVVENMALIGTKYPKPDERRAVHMFQWIQYQLDCCRTVEEVLATREVIRPGFDLGTLKLHYLICDASGNAATVEFLDGKMVFHRGNTLPAKALANNTYQESVAFMKSPAADEPPKGKGHGSLRRFTRAARCSLEFKSRSPEEDRAYGFHHLSDVAVGKFTVWSIVYDIANRKVFYRTRGNENIRWFSLTDFDFSPSLAPAFLDINAKGAGNVAADFGELTAAQHGDYLYTFYGKQDLKQEIGDLTPIVPFLLKALEGYRPKVQP